MNKDYFELTKDLKDKSREELKANLKKVDDTIIDLTTNITSYKDGMNKLDAARVKTEKTGTKALISFTISLVSCVALMILARIANFNILIPIISFIIPLVLGIFYEINDINNIKIINSICQVSETIKNLTDDILYLAQVRQIICLALDKDMYKDIYKNVYNIQEYLKTNDKKGYNSFEKAAKAINIDFSKYIQETI